MPDKLHEFPHSSGGEADGSDWYVPHVHVPPPTYWPMVLALGVAVFFWGFMTMLLVNMIGLGLIVISLVGWIGEIRHEHERA